MGKNEIKKIQKRNTLLQSSFELFTDKGFAKTTISDIVKNAGLAKGTFYLYFKDKYDVRDKLIAHKAGALFSDAHNYLLEHPLDLEEKDYTDEEILEMQVLAVVDYIVNYLAEHPPLLSFISKNLSWGVFKNAFETEVPEESRQFYNYYIEALQRGKLNSHEAEMMLFTVIELIGSTCYSCILHKQPVPMNEYLPYLHEAIKRIILI